MWPKALAQLIELAPHVSRLLPMADKFFQNRTAVDDSAKRAFDAMADGLRGDLGQVTAAHAGLYRQLDIQSVQLTAITSDVRANAALLDTTSARIAHLENRLDKMAVLLMVIAVLAVALIVLVAILLHRTHAPVY